MYFGTGLLGGAYKVANNILFSLFGYVIKKKKGRLTEFRDDDVVLVSYPKSGSVWMMFMLGNIQNKNEPSDFLNVHNRVTDLQLFDKRYFGDYKPRLLRSHEHFDRDYPKVIYVVRDPRSVSVSFYFHLLKRYRISKDTSFDSFLELFLKGKQNEQGSWDEHTGSWLGAWKRKPEKFHLVRYEDLKQDTNKILTEVVHFSGLEADESVIKRAIELSSFERMQKTEQDQQSTVRNLKTSDQRIKNVRKGKVDEWKQYFSEQQNDRIWSAFGHIMEQLGYRKELD